VRGTPRTDAALCRYYHPDWPKGRVHTINQKPVVYADLARELERELLAAITQRDELLAALQAQEDAEKWIEETHDDGNPFFEETLRHRLNHCRDLRQAALRNIAEQAPPTLEKSMPPEGLEPSA
jgi:phosphoserine phosphatase